MSRGFISRSQLTGIKGAFRGLDETRKLHLARLIAGVADMAKQIYERSQVYVPVDTGELKASGEWGPEESGLGAKFTKTNGVTYQVSYAAPYAVFVHENMSNYHAPPTGAKYLERAVQEVVNGNGGTIRWREEFTVPDTTIAATGQGGDLNIISEG